jgi:hypothetical protein
MLVMKNTFKNLYAGLASCQALSWVLGIQEESEQAFVLEGHPI